MPRFELKKEKKRGKREPLKKKVFKKKPCKFCMEKITEINYLDYPRFQKFMTERGKIVPSRISGNCARHQRLLARAVKRARVAALVPFVAE
ncbi:MAG: 30S ribosomal protein S18 [Candidatus Omnitrophota bacterium]|jgi:small subunit ribosomal protein S18